MPLPTLFSISHPNSPQRLHPTPSTQINKLYSKMNKFYFKRRLSADFSGNSPHLPLIIDAQPITNHHSPRLEDTPLAQSTRFDFKSQYQPFALARSSIG